MKFNAIEIDLTGLEALNMKVNDTGALILLLMKTKDLWVRIKFCLKRRII